jgi:hypothetical protein
MDAEAAVLVHSHGPWFSPNPRPRRALDDHESNSAGRPPVRSTAIGRFAETLVVVGQIAGDVVVSTPYSSGVAVLQKWAVGWACSEAADALRCSACSGGSKCSWCGAPSPTCRRRGRGRASSVAAPGAGHYGLLHPLQRDAPLVLHAAPSSTGSAVFAEQRVLQRAIGQPAGDRPPGRGGLSDRRQGRCR